MAFAGWITPSKLSGSGNDTVDISANALNTGRNSRSTNVTFKAVGCSDVIVVPTQAGKPEFASFDNTTAAAQKTGQTLTLSGTSNSSELTFSKGTDNIDLTLPSTYIANGLTINNGAAITGDPGATQQYVWSIQLTVPANASTDPLTCQIVVTDDAGHTHTCTITLAAGDATLSVSPLTIELPWDGSTSGTVTVTSNTNWTVE